MDANCEIAFVEADEPKTIKDADRPVITWIVMFGALTSLAVLSR